MISDPTGFAFFDRLGDPLTLHLADGRRWDCVVTTRRGDAVTRSGKGLYWPE